MRNKHMIRTLAVLLAVMLCMTAFSTVAFASDGEAATTSEAQTEPTDSADITGDDLSKLISALFGSVLGSTEKSGKTGTVTTNGGKLNVRTGAGLDNYAFTQLPNGTVVEVVGTDGDWYMVRLPEKFGYVYSGYMTLSDTGGEAGGGLSLSIDPNKLSELFEQLMGGGGAALTPDGNLSLIDDIGSSTRSGKQFITVEMKNGNMFYLIIDRDDEGEETVHFLNQVDEADLLSLMGDDAPAAEMPAVCNCKEKCVAGAVNMNCPVCKNNLSECSGKEVVAEPEPEPEQPEKKSSGGLLVIVLLLALAGGGAFAYVKFIKPKQGVKVSADPDDYDFEDEEMVNEDTEDNVND
ncbi:CD1107 family mobile element protein [Dysosmobacter sp.]|mgnify:CR=1 FL=1|uniref:CD1107 family mobile element protein n=1 Tax=Dysosmobacter sp. TaxID=2591382 RepID=UPI003AF191AA